MGTNKHKFCQNQTEIVIEKTGGKNYICGTAIYSEELEVKFLRKALDNVRKKVLKWLPDQEIYNVIKKDVSLGRKEILVKKFTDEIEYERYIYNLTYSSEKKLIGGLYQVEIVFVAKRVGVLVILNHDLFGEKVFKALFREIEKEYTACKKKVKKHGMVAGK